MFDDNIILSKCWDPPYRFIIVRAVLWDLQTNEIKHVTDEPEIAYILLMQRKSKDAGTIREASYEWLLLDSFNRDAEDFCRSMFETNMELPDDPLDVKIM